MNIPSEIPTIWPGIFLTFLPLALALFAQMAFGGFRIGRLARTIELTKPSGENEAFLREVKLRLALLNFKRHGNEERYIQVGENISGTVKFTHSKTKKELTLAVLPAGGAVQVRLSLQYLDPIVADTGESAYRDAVLDYVSGKTESMVVVPNLPYPAAVSLAGGTIALVVLVARQEFAAPWAAKFDNLLPLCSASIVIGLITVVASLRNPQEVRGRRHALTGIVLCLLALALQTVGIR